MIKIVRTATRVAGGLTEDEQRRMKEHADLWIARAMRTSPTDSSQLVPAIEGIYAAAGLKKPRVVIVPSPLVLAFAYGAAAWIWHCRKDNATYDATRDATDAATYAATECAEVKKQRYKGHGPLFAAECNRITEQLHPELGFTPARVRHSKKTHAAVVDVQRVSCGQFGVMNLFFAWDPTADDLKDE